MFANYHTHTFRCHHATGSEREYIEEAIRAGIRVLGFSDHAPQFFDDGFVSPIRMLPSEAEEYVATLRRLADEYRNEIEIRIGFEAEYFPSIFPQLRSFCRDIGVEYLILGQHLLHDERPGMWISRIGNDPARLPVHVDEILEGLATGAYTYLAHPDMFVFTGDPADYRREMLRLLHGVKALGLPIEYNLLGRRERRHYPAAAFWELVPRVGCEVILGRDAHAPIMLGECELENEGRAELAALGITPLERVTLRPL